MKQVDPKFCSPLRPIVVIGLTTRRFRRRLRAVASCEFGSHGIYGALIPKDLKIHTIRCVGRIIEVTVSAC